MELTEKYLVISLDVVGVSRHHEQQHGVALDMAEEAESETLAFGSTLDDAGNVGHYE